MEVEQNGNKKSKEVDNVAPVQFSDVTIFSTKFFDENPDPYNYNYVPADALIKNFYIWKRF